MVSNGCSFIHEMLLRTHCTVSSLMIGGSTLSPRKKGKKKIWSPHLFSSLQRIACVCTMHLLARYHLSVTVQREVYSRLICGSIFSGMSGGHATDTVQTLVCFHSKATFRCVFQCHLQNDMSFHFYLFFNLRYKWQSPYRQNPHSGLLPLKTYLQFSFSVTI